VIVFVFFIDRGVFRVRLKVLWVDEMSSIVIYMRLFSFWLLLNLLNVLV